MAYFKIVRKTLEINGSSRSTSIDLRAEVFSYDKNVNKFLFELTSKEAEIDLTGATVRVLLTYVGNDGKKGIIEDNGGVEAYTMNQIYYLLPEELRGYDGTVVMGLYVDLPSGEAIDIQNVQFRMFKSSIDDGAGVAGVVYFKSFEEWLFQVKEKALLEIQNIDDESERITEYADTKIKEYDDKFVQSNQKMSELQQSQIELSDQLNETNKKIDEADVYRKDEVFNKPESSANVIYQVIGKEKAEITFRLDAKSEFVKVSSVGYTTLLSPTNVSWTPLTEEQLNNLSSLDGSLYSARDVAANYMKQLKYDCDILGFFKSLLGEKFFTIRGATTDSQKVEVLESLITDFTSNVYGYGSGGGINKLTHRNWNGTWTVSDSTAANEVTRIGQTIESTDTNWKKLINGGKISVLSNSEPTISPNYSTVNIDYLCLDVTIELSANEHFEYMIAANHIENLATEEEAETGEDNKKIMTPLRVMQSIKKFVENKFVSIAGNETIGGLKNFRDGLMVKENTVLTHKGVVTIKYSNADFPTEIASGYITFVRYGDEIQVVFNFKTRTDKDFAKDQSIIWGIAADFQADTSEPQYIGIASTGGTTSLVKFTANGATLTAHSTLTKDTWYAGTVTYLAKNKL
ncbi:BppU family phage baseplate upper protein [Enterococcus avium]|uniref:BppU family phage baseplate upper protein n=1 Tax=Enterococcus avium TaxID=33945 RepID=UPI00288DC66B|nr:BppU family phage baseplate upper protein [Enterococcus avium]MDT2461746.1 BppU family phage baseplate upper protein [Enterococcus avium]